MQLCGDIALSGNPAVDHVDEGKRWGLSHFKQNSRLSSWTSKQKKNKHDSVTNVNPMHICLIWTADVPQHRFSSARAPYGTTSYRWKMREFKGAAQADISNIFLVYCLPVFNLHCNISDCMIKQITSPCRMTCRKEPMNHWHELISRTMQLH